MGNLFQLDLLPILHLFPRFSALGCLPIFEVFGGALNRAGALTRAGALIKTDESVDSPFPKIKRMIEKI